MRNRVIELLIELNDRLLKQLRPPEPLRPTFVPPGSVLFGSPTPNDEIEPEPGRFRYFTQWLDAPDSMQVQFSVGGSNGMYHKSRQVESVWRWDSQELIGAVFHPRHRQWLFDEDPARFIYRLKGSLDPITTATATRILEGMGHPEALDDLVTHTEWSRSERDNRPWPVITLDL